MRHIAGTWDLLPTDVLAVHCESGGLDVYEPGDELSPQPEQPVPAPTRYITAAEYRHKFTDAELVAMLTSTDVGVKLLVLKTSTAPPEGIDLLSQPVADGLAYLVSKGILTADRSAQIVD